MPARILSLLLVTCFLCPLLLADAQSPSWTQLSLSTCGVDEFLKDNPTSDGRGVVIAILDTGVDPGIPGLTHTPDGEVKMVDMQDCTGEGDIELHWINLDEESGKLIEYDDDGTPIEYTPPALPESEEARRFWFGTWREAKFVNSDIADLNDNGETDDEFPVLVTALIGDGDDQAVCYIDGNLDRSFADEKPLQSYHVKFDSFNLHRDAPERQIVPATFGLNIFLRQRKVTIHWDDGAHGTHVAGIAAGYKINNQEGFNGVAPGAKLMSLKIGQNAIGGVTVTESVKKALEHAAWYARKHNVHVVCNMSFGVESEIEGYSDIDKWVDDFLVENPYLTFCTSAGNEGPGLSSVGTPAASYHIISVGAMMAADTGRDVAAYDLDDAVITSFSSRGGELAKPDIVVPGWSTSTVPRYNRGGDFWAGTSMASPYAAGLSALLISDVLAKDSNAKVRAWDVRRALSLSGRHVKDATPLDEGWGVPDLAKAAKILHDLMPKAADDPLIGYKISTACPTAHEGTSRAAFWRGMWFPVDDPQTFTIRPVFAPATDEAQITGFARKFELRSDGDWLSTKQESIYLRGEQSATVRVDYDADKLKSPGVYTGYVEAVYDGLVAFRLMNTVIVPHRFNEANDHILVLKNQTANGWMPDRHFVAVPPGASAMRITLSAPEGEKSKARLPYVADPTGHGHRVARSRLDTDNGLTEVVKESVDDLTPGVWEIPVIASLPDDAWPYELRVEFFGLHPDPPVITEWSGRKSPSGELVVTNLFEKRVTADADGRVEGYRKSKSEKFEGLKHELTYSIDLGDDRFNAVRLDLEMTPEDYATTTDIGVMVKDGSGEAIYSSGFDNRRHRTTVRGSGKLTLVITGGFAVADDKRETPIEVNIDRLFASPLDIKVSRGDSSSINFIPSVPIPIEFKVRGELGEEPKGENPVGYLRFRARNSHETLLRVPIEIE